MTIESVLASIVSTRTFPAHHLLTKKLVIKKGGRKLKGQKRIDTDLLKHLLRLWERRFCDKTIQQADVLIAELNQYSRRYGQEARDTLVHEVQLEVANEMKGGEIEYP